MVWNYSNTSTETTLTASITPSATTITVASTSGLPVSFPFSLILDFEQPNVEVVTVTGLAGLNLTVTRGEDGTAAQSHNLGARVVHGLVARDAREPQTHIAATQDVHGVGAGNSVVGTGTTQTLTNKTITDAASISSVGAIGSTRAAATDTSFEAKVSGDVVRRHTVEASGKHVWSDGTNPTDTNLYRSAADTLKTDDTLEVAGDIKLPSVSSRVLVGGSPSVASFTSARTSGNELFLSVRRTADTENRLQSTVDGVLNWGPGNVAPDTNLYRSAANTLKTDDSLEVAGNQTVNGNQTVSGDQTVTGIGGFLFARKTALESLASQITLQDDNHLFVTVVSGGVYILDAFIIYDAVTGGDIVMKFSAPAGSILDWSIWGLTDAAVGSEGTIEVQRDPIGAVGNAGGAGAPIVTARPTGLLVAGANGTFKLQWAQLFSNASATTVHANSWLRLQRIG